MKQPFIRSLILGNIEQAGRSQGAPPVTFTGNSISVPGESIYVRPTLPRSLTGINGFYLTLPADTFGVVIFPDGTSHNMEGGLHEVPAGLYNVQYVDKHERLEAVPPVSEMSTDGEKITLTLVLRYKVLDPIVALRTEHPVETLIEHVKTDVAQYIRTHSHDDIADSSQHNQDSKLLTYFVQRHNRRLPFSKAFSITGIEIKEFTGDDEYVEMRRRASVEAIRNQLDKQQVEYQQQMTLVRAQFKADGEKAMAEHNAMLVKKAAEHKAEIEKIEATHEKEKQEILDQVRVREIDLDNKRRQLRIKQDEFSQLMGTLSDHFTSGSPTNPAVFKVFTDLLLAYKEDLENESPPTPAATDNGNPAKEERRPPAGIGSRASSDKVETLKNTLLNLLNPQK